MRIIRDTLPVTKHTGSNENRRFHLELSGRTTCSRYAVFTRLLRIRSYGGRYTLNQTVKDNLAKNAYLKFGFAGYALDPQTVKALFWDKPL